MTRSAKKKAEDIASRKATGQRRRGDAKAGHGKDRQGPKGGRNSGGRGRS